MAQARYHIHLPQQHKEGHDLPLALEKIRKALTNAGLHGRQVLRDVEADHGDREPIKMSVIIVDGEDDERTDHAIHAVVEAYKALAGHPWVYVTKQPITTWLI